MPLILDRADFGLWLDPGMQDVERLKPLLVPMVGEELETVPVSKRVNSPAYDGPECVEPLVEKET